MSASPLTMLTFAPMIDSECTRLVLRHYGLPFKERDRLFAWVSLLTLLHGGYGRVPLVHGRGVACSGPAACMRQFDPLQPAERKLLPLEEPLRQRVEADFATYNNALAADVAAFAYFHLLPERALMIRSFGAPLTPLGRSTLPSVYGPLRGLFSLLLRLRPARIADVTRRIEALLDWSDRRLKPGQLYLQGGRRTLADLGLMSAMAPILLPPAYRQRVPALERMPVKLCQLVEQTRARPIGRFTLRLYEEFQPA
jgi:glutathione S-transferase